MALMSRPQFCLLRVTDVKRGCSWPRFDATLFYFIRYFHISIIHLVYPQKFCISIVSNFSSDLQEAILLFTQLHLDFGLFLADKIGIVFETKNCIVPIFVWKTFIRTGN